MQYFYGTNWKEMSILTQTPKDETTEITGYSGGKLEKGDQIFISQTDYYEVIEEVERRDAKGKRDNGESENRWFKAIAKLNRLN